MKSKYEIKAVAFRKGSDQIVDRGFVCFTHAVSEKQARSNVKYRYPQYTLRDMRVSVINSEPKKEVVGWTGEQLSFI